MRARFEYIWIDGAGSLRSKNRFLEVDEKELSITDLPTWNFDGSSTGQGDTKDSERFLLPVYFCPDPFIPTGVVGYLVLCAVYQDPECRIPINGNNYDAVACLFYDLDGTDPWFGFEQEFFLLNREGRVDGVEQGCLQGPYYCGVGADRAFHRAVMDSFTQNCIRADIHLYGTNAEVAPGQWEFQIGTVAGIEACHELWIGRYILMRTAERMNLCVSWDPKPFPEWNGSGCHTNFSTRRTREEGGYAEIQRMIRALEGHHEEHIRAYGEGNERRLTGHHETASIDGFSWSVGGRHTSIRVGQDVARKGSGYFEDRRPASNCDPYLVAGLLLANTR